MIRFFNGKVLSMNGSMDITDGEVWTDGDRISYVGPAKQERPVFDREIDLKGDLIMPGFKNAHAHSAMTFVRSFADDLPLQSWLFDKIFPLEARLTPDDVYDLTRLAILEYLAGGITAAFDMYYKREAFAQASLDCGYRMVLCGALSAGDDWSVGDSDCEKFNSMGPLISYIPGIHAEYTASTDLLAYMKGLIGRTGKPFYAHNSETRAEVAECIERHGLTPTALFEEFGLFENGGGGFHCVHMTEADLEIFSRRGLWVVNCPGSNAKLASGVAPITEMQSLGINLALGTDGPASNNALNMFREMYLAIVLQKLQFRDAAVGDAAEVLRMACSGGAGAMGLEADCLAPGRLADLVVIDLDQPNMYPVHNTVKNLVYSGSNTNVRLTMVGGKVLYENGEFFVGDKPEEIYRRAQISADRLTKD
jgi:5-methylthioadenosine/S-adenosylhomocysteine deaminase